MKSYERFEKGDLIEVVAGKGVQDFGVIRGTALDTRGYGGDAYFKVSIVTTPQGHTQTLEFSLNYVDVERIFSADVARGL